MEQPETYISSYDIGLTIVIATILFLMLVSFCIVFLLTYQKRKQDYQKEKHLMETTFKQELLQTQLETQEYSFNQISQELHDNIGQLLSSTKLLLNVSERELSYIPDPLKTAKETLSKAIQDLRALSKSLSKEWVHQFNLIENLKEETNRINAARSIEVELKSQYEKLPLEPEAQVMLFRVVQEALQNSIKHAEPKHICIQINNIDNHFEVEIEDDGRGFNFSFAQTDGLGLRNMQHRTQLLGGTIGWKRGEIAGTAIKIRIPVKSS